MSFTRTYDLRTQKVALKKLSRNGNGKIINITGFECAPPVRGESYSIYVGKEKTFKTSPVKDIKETYYAVLIKTDNAVYQIKYM
jgi:hypothetical protein